MPPPWAAAGPPSKLGLEPSPPAHACSFLNTWTHHCDRLPQAPCVPPPTCPPAGTTKIGVVGMVTMAGSDVNVEEAEILFLEEVSQPRV